MKKELQNYLLKQLRKAFFLSLDFRTDPNSDPYHKETYPQHWSI